MCFRRCHSNSRRYKGVRCVSEDVTTIPDDVEGVRCVSEDVTTIPDDVEGVRCVSEDVTAIPGGDEGLRCVSVSSFVPGRVWAIIGSVEGVCRLL